MHGPIGSEFQSRTKYVRGRMQSAGYVHTVVPDTSKRLDDSARILLPSVAEPPGESLHSVLANRRSVREYEPSPLDLSQLSYLLWAADGVSARANGCEFRTAPSAGALYPVETYLVVNNVYGIVPGVYYYRPSDHCIFILSAGDYRAAITDAALGQEMCAEAPVVFVWTAVFPRSVWRYGQRAYRYAYLDAGHIAQNLALASVALGLGTCQIGALFDDEVNQILSVDGESESVVYMSVVGTPSE